MDYVVVIEKADDGSYSAYVPDLPGCVACVACGDTPEEVRTAIKEAVALHIESLRDHREPVPPPTAMTDVVHAA
ncbi:MAG TPA: type II toxin-antitoxin system HicB family antitoxin [Tepidisphaeraceae bacterium]|jgi:predicted RNase H-like HicB family nuclease